MSATIDDLPDDILIDILSYLSTKESFRTRVLSKRWLPLCLSLPLLHFENDDIFNFKDQDFLNEESGIRFRQFLDAVILSPHSQHISVKSFHLVSEIYENDSFSFNLEWLEVLKLRRVEDLYLNLMYKTVSPCLFCCKTLVVLKLRSISVASSMSTFSADLPLLKTLDLSFVHFHCKQDLAKLLSGCPKLEDFKSSYVEPRCLLQKPLLSNLIKANIRLLEVPLTAVYNVQFLTISRMSSSHPNEKVDSDYKAFPLFQNIIELRLFWSHYSIHDWNEVVKMLQNCPKLKALYINKGGYSSNTTEDWKDPSNVPECVYSHLTTCNIIKYQGVQGDFLFATYILKNARFLREMTIDIISDPNLRQGPQILKGLSSCPRISPACKLSISDKYSIFH